MRGQKPCALKIRENFLASLELRGVTNRNIGLPSTFKMGQYLLYYETRVK